MLQPPFRGFPPAVIGTKILMGDRPECSASGPLWTRAYATLAEVCWSQEPSGRITARQLFARLARQLDNSLMPSVGEQQLQQQPIYIRSAAELGSLSLHPASVTSLVIEADVEIDPEGCKHLAKLPSLTQLEIGHGNEIGPEGCKHLAQLRRLTQLSMRNSFGG
eukprot:2758069-Amphidinium_carterae.1